MKEVWVRLDTWSKELAIAAIESGADALVLPSGCRERAAALGRILVIAPDGDLEPGQDVYFERLRSAEDEARIARRLLSAAVVIGPDPAAPGEKPADSSVEERPVRRAWEVIPVENLVAGGGRLLLSVDTEAEARLALGVLEKGVSGVVITARSAARVRELVAFVKGTGESFGLAVAEVESVRPAGMGDRVCVDTCTLMGHGQGLLVGNSSGFLFLVHAEVAENPYVAPRPFRVNAGPVHAYVRIPGGGTRYLAELAAGDPVLLVNFRGESEEAVVGRVKIERRPLVLVTVVHEGVKGSILLQNAETIRLAVPDGTARSVVDLEPGDPVLVHLEESGRHFGMKVDETIREK